MQDSDRGNRLKNQKPLADIQALSDSPEEAADEKRGLLLRFKNMIARLTSKRDKRCAKKGSDKRNDNMYPLY